MTNISISLYNTEVELLKASPDDLNEKDKKVTRKLHRNQVLEKFYAGQRDEKYTKDYYELLKNLINLKWKQLQERWQLLLINMLKIMVK